jgi:glyoxylase-like metal-dependent hydrolase (beta-lactamase superfamily II)
MVRAICSLRSRRANYGKNDAVRVDPPLTVDQARTVGDWVKANGKKLTHIFVTHGHADDWFSAGVLEERFGAQVVASVGTIEQMQIRASIREVFWDKLWPLHCVISGWLLPAT